MWATRACSRLGHAFIIRWGCFWAKDFTDTAARRSELPSRSTGFTAEPRTAAPSAQAFVGLRLLGELGHVEALPAELGDRFLSGGSRR